tara:strand:- start:41 stop:1276 length:1236 start_codon:yes stop_codon:yes gene_type:complete
MVWNGGTEPTLMNTANAGDAQVFKLTTRDNGATWYAGEVASNENDPTYSLYGWGSNSNGSIGQNNTTKYSSPTQITGDWIKLHQAGTETWSSSLGATVFAAKGSSGQLWAWGYNAMGNVLQNNRNDGYSSPVQIPGTTWSVARGVTYNGGIATKTDGTLWTWGYNSDGRLGQNQLDNHKSSPVQVGTDTTWGITDDQLSSGAYGSIAIKTDGTLWAWGRNHWGMLGQNQGAPAKYSSPIQIPGTTWAKLSRGGGGNTAPHHAIKTDGTLWSWGYGGQGELGVNNRTQYSSPVQVPGTNWSHVRKGFSCTFGFKTDGTLWAWGYPAAGMLAQNEVISRSSPVQIPGTNWDDLVSIQYSSIAKKTDGTLWAWGNNSSGQLGNNNRTTYSSPIQIPGTWNSISSGGESFFALKS